MSKNFDISSLQDNISLNIKYLRELLNFTQKELGDETGMKRGLTNNYENKKSLPPLDFICEICKLGNVTVDDFLKTRLSEKDVIKSFSQEREPSGINEYEKWLADKDKIIQLQEREIAYLRGETKNKGKTA